ncbi:MAG: ATP synthase F1 subunit delta [Bacteroidota bacterium]
MPTTSVATRYAKSLLHQAKAENALRDIHASVSLCHQILKTYGRLREVLKSPILHRAKKATVLQALFSGKVHALVLKFFDFISQRGREAILPEIMEAFLAQYDAIQGTRTAYLKTAFALPQSMIAGFEKLTQALCPCRAVTLVQDVNPRLLGGYILQVADKQLDQSLKQQLRVLQQHYGQDK